MTPARTKVPLPTEHAEQCAVIDWWRLYCVTRKLPEPLLFSIPNGTLTNIAGHMRMKKEGFRKGAPDLMLAVSKRGPKVFIGQTGLGPDGKWIYEQMFDGLFIEMKRKGEKARPEQIAFADMLRRQGYSVVIAQGADEAIRAIRGYIET